MTEQARTFSVRITAQTHGEQGPHAPSQLPVIEKKGLTDVQANAIMAKGLRKAADIAESGKFTDAYNSGAKPGETHRAVIDLKMTPSDGQKSTELTLTVPDMDSEDVKAMVEALASME